jgi:hypothetical protein
MMKKRCVILSTIILFVVGLLVFIVAFSATPILASPDPAPTPSGRIATLQELAVAQSEWENSGHAETFDRGLGANTTCARCKSPMNWDPTQNLAAQEALDCGACKRIPGAPRPELETGVPVPATEWIGIPCDVCHIPAGDSYYVEIAFWNQEIGQYELLANSFELCSKCHEGQHGFEVVEEQLASAAHNKWDCTRCHGVHGDPSNCTDCHDPQSGVGSFEHARHPSVNCTGCHDNGGLSLWYDLEPQSGHYGEYITRRFAHTLTSWPSHNLSRQVVCERCHHPLGNEDAAVVPYLSCEACHEHENGAVWIWCIYFERDSSPFPDDDRDSYQP